MSIPVPSPMPNRKTFDCTKCDHYQLNSTPPNLGQCRAHPPRYCPGDPTASNQWPQTNPSDLFWCDEFKRASFAAKAAGINPHNPQMNEAGLCCASCDHYQPAPTEQAPQLGLCMAHPPRATCLVANGDDREANAFPVTDGKIAGWCSEWKRRTTE